MMQSAPCTFARARSMSRYLAVRFSSDQTSRMRASLNMSPKMRESMMVEAMVLVPSNGLRGAQRLDLPGVVSQLREDRVRVFPKCGHGVHARSHVPAAGGQHGGQRPLR